MLPQPLFSLSQPIGRGALLAGAGLLTAAAAGVLGLAYGVAMPLDSMHIMVGGVLIAAFGFALGILVLMHRRLIDMGARPHLGMALWVVLVFAGVNLVDMRALPAKLVGLALVLAALAPLVLERMPERKKNPPETGGS